MSGAREQELIPFKIGSAPRLPNDPLLYVDVTAREIRLIVDGTIIPLGPISPGQKGCYALALERLIEGKP